MVTLHKATEVPEPMPFRFLSLPAEIRNVIYKLLLIPNQEAVLSVHETPARPKFIPIWPLPYRPIRYFDNHRTQYGVSLRRDPTVVLLNHQVHAEYSGVHLESSNLLVGIWDKVLTTSVPGRLGKDLQRPPLRYLKSARIFVNAGWELSKGTWNLSHIRYALHSFECEIVEMQKAVRCLVAALRMMPRLESLEITYVNWVKDKREYSDYDPKAGLGPFAELVGLRDVSIKGDLRDDYAARLRSSMMRPKISSIQRNETWTSPLRLSSPASSSFSSWSSSSSGCL